MIEENPKGRKYRNMIECDVYVKDWDSFKESWKPIDFKGWADLTPEDLISQMHLRLNELLEDQKKLCYLLPETFLQEYQKQLVQILQSPKFFEYLGWEHEPLFLGKKKQLIIFKKRSSIVAYLAKYRAPQKYKEYFSAVQKQCSQYQKLLIERNMAISLDKPIEEVQKCTKAIEDFKLGSWKAGIKNYRKIVKEMMEDFIKQENKYEIPFVAISSLIFTEIKEIADKLGLFVSNRYTNISDQDEYKDIIVTKESRELSDPSFDDDDSLSNFSESQEEGKEEKTVEEIKKQAPKDIDNATITFLTEDGPECQINIYSFGTKRPTQKLQIVQISPQQTNEQKDFIHQVVVSPQKLQYTVVLPILNQGLTTYSIRAVSQFGKSRAKLVRVWNTPDTSSSPFKQNKKDKAAYMLGKSQEGLIPNWEPEANVILATTNQKWQKLKLGCSDFSVSTHGAICNAEGFVAGWGKMYYFNDGQEPNIVDPLEEVIPKEENDVLKEQKQILNEEEEEAINQIGYLNPVTLRVQNPSLILQNKRIRRVSCGEGYCLMADSFGKAWSFGMNTAGQLGLGHVDKAVDTSDPILIPAFKNDSIFVVDVFASFNGASFALTENGTAYRWGADQMDVTDYPVHDNYNNIINYQYYGVTTSQHTPLQITSKILSQKIASIHPGNGFVLFLTTERNLYGSGACRMLGKGVVENCHFNQIENLCNPIFIMKDVNRLSAGSSHCLVLKDDSTLIGWGDCKSYRKEGGDKFVNKPQTVKQNFKGQFVCGPDFSVFHSSQNDIEVVGRGDIFGKGRYELPCAISKMKAGKDLIMVME